MSESMRMQESMRQLSGRLDNIQTQIDQLWSKLDTVSKSSRSDAQSVADRIESRLQDLESDLQRVDAARASDKKEIIDKMSSKLSKFLAERASNASSGARVSEYGVEHTVKPGETLSEIAAAYRVNISALSKANSLKNPNSLRVGQKLFIPE